MKYTDFSAKGNMKKPVANINRHVVLSRLLFLYVIFAVLFAPLYASAYNPPIGIPDPALYWGGNQNPIDDSRPTRPSPWNSEVAGYYYINDDTGSNSGNTYGTPGNPRQTIPEPIPAGSYVEIHGTYNTATGGNISLKGAGDSGTWAANTSGPAWVVFEDGDTNSKFDTSAAKILIQGTYLYLDGVRIDGTNGSSHAMLQIGSATTGYDADFIAVRNSNITGNKSMNHTSGVGVVGDETNVVSKVVIYNNEIHDTGDVNSANDDDAHITTVGNYSEYIWFLENRIHDGSGSGAQVGGASSGADNCSYIFYGKNENYNSRQGGLWVKYANNVIFSQNIIHDIIDTNWSFSKGMGGQYTNDNIWYLYNTIYAGTTNTMSQGIYIASGGESSPRRLYVIGNLIYNIKNGGLYWSSVDWSNTFSPAGIFINGGSEVTVVNNTIWAGNSHGIVNTKTGTIIDENIVGGKIEPGAFDLWSENTTSVTTDYNLIFNNSDLSVKWGSTPYTSLSSFQSNTSQCDNCLVSDPDFIDVQHNNFHLKPTSPAKAQGVRNAVYNTFSTLYGTSIAYDIDGIPRPASGTNWDLGAFQSRIPPLTSIGGTTN